VGEAAALCETRLRARWPEATVMTYGHLGDGNIHIVVDVPGMDKHEHEDIDRVIYDVTREYEGSISAEHGIGIKKRHFLSQCRRGTDIDAMRAIKRSLDPQGLLNPGKVF
jgi:FAD/FMN-containing dehydrogenase